MTAPEIQSQLDAVKSQYSNVVPLQKKTIELAIQIDWHELAKKDFVRTWLSEPWLLQGVWVALVAAAGAGKSLLVQEASAAVATGRAFLRQAASEPKRVLYLDFENSEQDIQERIFLMFGYTEVELDNFIYLHYPDTPAFDGPDAVDWWNLHLDAYKPELVVVDTLSRVVSGEENSADTYIRFFRQSALAIKRRGLTLVTLDHLGKDADRGGRGSSAKKDGPEFVLQMTTKAISEGNVTLTLKNTKGRSGALPAQIIIKRKNGRHYLDPEEYTSEEFELARLLDSLSLPLDISVRAAATALKDAGHRKRTEMIAKALRARRLPNFKRSPKQDDLASAAARTAEEDQSVTCASREDLDTAIDTP